MIGEPGAHRRARLPSGVRDVLVGILLIGGCVAAQLLLPTAVLTCERGADGAASCLIERVIFFGTVSRSREDVRGVSGARTTQWDNRSKRDDYSVALITDRGELELDVPSSEERASEVTRAVTQLFERGDTRVEAVLRPSLSRQLQGGALLLLTVAGGWRVVHGVRHWRQRPDDRSA